MTHAYVFVYLLLQITTESKDFEFEVIEKLRNSLTCWKYLLIWRPIPIYRNFF